MEGFETLWGFSGSKSVSIRVALCVTAEDLDFRFCMWGLSSGFRALGLRVPVTV